MAMSCGSYNSPGPPSMGQLPETEQIVSLLERGTVMYRFFSRKRPENGKLYIRRETREILWKRATGSGGGRVTTEIAGKYTTLLSL